MLVSTTIPLEGGLGSTTVLIAVLYSFSLFHNYFLVTNQFQIAEYLRNSGLNELLTSNPRYSFFVDSISFLGSKREPYNMKSKNVTYS